MLGLQKLRAQMTEEQKNELQAKQEQRANDPYRRAFNMTLAYQRGLADAGEQEQQVVKKEVLKLKFN